MSERQTDPEKENWTRVAVVLSVIWFIAITFWVFTHDHNKVVGSAQALYESCASSPHGSMGSCLKGVITEDYPHNRDESMADALHYWPTLAFGPLVVVWTALYLFKKFFWDRRGSKAPR